MSSIHHFPNEILENIFKTVSATSNRKYDLYNCALVCQSWYLSACRVLYERVLVKQRCRRLVTCLSLQRKNLGVFCRVIELYDGYTRKRRPTAEQYDQLFSYLPNLHTVIIGYKNTVDDFQHLNRNASKLKYLKDLEVDTLDYSGYPSHTMQAYYNCASIFKRTLQRMKLDRPLELITASSGAQGHVYTFLPEFTSLTSLHFKIQADRHNRGLQQLSMFHILRLCPNLTKLTYINEFKEPKVDESNVQLVHNNLKDLEIVLIELTKLHLDCMIKSITGLKRLSILVRPRMYRQQPMEKLYLHEIHHLQVYLSKIDRVDFIAGKDFITTMIDYWLFIDGVSGNEPSTPKHLSMKLVKINDNTFSQNQFKLCKREKSIFFHSEMDINELGSWKNIDLLQSSFIPKDLRCKKMIRSLQIHYLLSDIEEEENIYRLRLSVLLSTIKSSPSIHYFNMALYSMSGPNFAPKFQVLAASNKIDYHRDQYNRTFSPTLAPPHYSSDFSNKLTYVKINNVQSPEEIGSILSILPNTMYLTLFDSFKDLDENFNITLDLGNLHLRLLHLDLTTLALSHSGSRQTIILHIKEEATNQNRYYKWKRERKKFTDITFQPVNATFLTNYGRFLSANCNIVVLKLYRVEQIMISCKVDYWNIVETCVDLSTQ